MPFREQMDLELDGGVDLELQVLRHGNLVHLREGLGDRLAAQARREVIDGVIVVRFRDAGIEEVAACDVRLCDVVPFFPRKRAADFVRPLRPGELHMPLGDGELVFEAAVERRAGNPRFLAYLCDRKLVERRVLDKLVSCVQDEQLRLVIADKRVVHSLASPP